MGLVVIFFSFYFNGSPCNWCPFPLVLLQGTAKNSGPYSLLFPSLLLHTLTRPHRASFFQGWTTLTLPLPFPRFRSLQYLLVLFWAPEKLWNWTHTPPVQLRNHKCTCRYQGGTYLWRLLCHLQWPQCHTTSSKKLSDTLQSTTPHTQWWIQVLPRETQSKTNKLTKFHSKNWHYCKLRLRVLKEYDMQKINMIWHNQLFQKEFWKNNHRIYYMHYMPL